MERLTTERSYLPSTVSVLSSYQARNTTYNVEMDHVLVTLGAGHHNDSMTKNPLVHGPIAAIKTHAMIILPSPEVVR